MSNFVFLLLLHFYKSEFEILYIDVVESKEHVYFFYKKFFMNFVTSCA
jgi:hypothetical protein